MILNFNPIRHFQTFKAQRQNPGTFCFNWLQDPTKESLQISKI
jgi:hypothetical protein